MDLRAVSRNLMHDHRVSDARDASLRRFGDGSWTPADLQRAIVRYQHDSVRTRHLPEFVYRAFNEDNIVTPDARLPRFDRNIRLARVLDLNGLLTVYQWARQQAVEPFASWLPWPVNDQQIARLLDRTLNGAAAEEIETFVAATLSALAAYSATNSYQPAWCTTWSDFAPFIDAGADRWIEALGVAARGIGRWMILLTYRVKDVGTLVRPTQLDVGWDARGHFPSPPDAPVWRGGHPMDLGGQGAFRRLLPEYIHRQVPHTLDHWLSAGRRLGVTTRPSHVGLATARRAHHELLVLHYGQTSIYNWMGEPI